MKKILPALFLSAVVLACSNNASTETEAADTAAAAPNETSAAAAINVQTAFPDFYRFLSQQDSSFSATRFEQWATDTLPSLPAQPIEEERLQPFRPYLIYNRDSSLAIDLYSYNYVPVQKEGKTVLEEGGPDTEVAVVDPKANTRQRIFFSGPGTTVAGAKWLDEHTVLLAGAEEVSTDAVKPVVWKINLPERKREIYRYNDSLRATVSGFAPANRFSGGPVPGL